MLWKQESASDQQGCCWCWWCWCWCRCQHRARTAASRAAARAGAGYRLPTLKSQVLLCASHSHSTHPSLHLGQWPLSTSLRDLPATRAAALQLAAGGLSRVLQYMPNTTPPHVAGWSL
jgi:hypothetical protein